MNDNSDYQKALKNTAKIEEPEVGFAKVKASVNENNQTIVKQNNTILSFLVVLSEKLDRISQDVNNLKVEKASTSKEKLDEITTRLENLSLGPKEPKKQPKGVLRLHKDPYKILQQELEKVKK